MQFPHQKQIPGSSHHTNHLYLTNISQNVPVSSINSYWGRSKSKHFYKYVIYEYTHIYSVHRMMVWVLTRCVLLSGMENIKKVFLMLTGQLMVLFSSCLTLLSVTLPSVHFYYFLLLTVVEITHWIFDSPGPQTSIFSFWKNNKKSSTTYSINISQRFHIYIN